MLSPPLIPYDPSVVPICGNVAAALQFCWYEHLFREAGYPAEGITRVNIIAWRTGLGYRAERPMPWFRQFYKIGTIHYGRRLYAAAVEAQREFVSQEFGGYVFYAMELYCPAGKATLHRNAALIDRRLSELRGLQPTAPDVTELRGANREAKSLIAQLEGTR